LHALGNYEQIKVGECLLPFGLESFVVHLLTKNTTITIHRTIILPVILCGCEASSLALSEHNRLRVFEDRALRKLGNESRTSDTEVKM
jgi:hypothetical protein